MGAARLTLAEAPEGLEELLFEVLSEVPCSWTRQGRDVVVWVEEENAPAVRAALLAEGMAFREAREAERDWVAESASLRKAVAVGRYLLDPHDGERATPAEGRTRLHVPAERAFGTGSHESTRIALSLLTAQALAGKRVLDVGCGAGTLAFVASCEGAAHAVAFDIDLDAAFATRAGARRNRIARVASFAGPVEALREGALFDVAVANMIAEELAPILPAIDRRLRAGGVLVTSGQLAARRDAFEETLGACGFSALESETEGEWIGFVAARRP